MRLHGGVLDRPANESSRLAPLLQEGAVVSVPAVGAAPAARG